MSKKMFYRSIPLFTVNKPLLTVDSLLELNGEVEIEGNGMSIRCTNNKLKMDLNQFRSQKLVTEKRPYTIY